MKTISQLATSLALILLFSHCHKDKDGEKEVLPPAPVIKATQPTTNPVNWPVLITGEAMENITEIKFGDKIAPIDTNIAGIVTTRVPGGLPKGPVQLTVKTKGGISNSFKFEILDTLPFMGAVAPKIVIRKRATYLIRLPDGDNPQNGWTNEYDNTHKVILTNTGNSFETIKGQQYTIKEFSGDDKLKTITVQIIRGQDDNGNDIIDVYHGDFVDAGSPNRQRIIYTDKYGRQMVVSVATQ